jgi:GNAT superfamily N-acetyltransferase
MSETSSKPDTDAINFLKVTSNDMFPEWAPRDKVVDFFHYTMEPYHDSKEDINRALDYAFSSDPGRGGFLMLCEVGGKLMGALLMLDSGMGGYIPENILLFVTVSPDSRGMGIGGKLINRCIDECEGEVKLHVDHDNPAKRLYERLGFKHDYAEMRFHR